MTALRSLALGVLVAVSTVGTGADAAALRSQTTPTWNWWWSAASYPQTTPTATAPAAVPIAAAQSTAVDTSTVSNSSPAVTATFARNVTPVATQYAYDAYIDMGIGPFAGAGTLTTGSPQAWYNSPVVQQLYGHTPTAQEQADFSSTILQRVAQTYTQSGLPINLTSISGSQSAHSLSVVSNASYGPNPNAVGIANVGGDGFSFIDQFKYANSVNDLEWAIAHNVAHELMHAFGGDHHDTTGNYLDAATISWDKLIDPSLTFSPASVAELLSKNFRERDGGMQLGAEMLAVSPSPVPEPTTIALWSLAGAVGLLVQRRRRRAA